MFGAILDCTLIWYSDLFAEFCKGSHIPGKSSSLGIPLYLWDTLVEIQPNYLIDFNVEIHPNYLIDYNVEIHPNYLIDYKILPLNM